MYNRYLNAEGFDQYFAPAEQAPAPFPPPGPEPPPAPPPEPPKGRGGLLGGLGERLKLPNLDGDTILLLVLVYFLIADGEEKEDKNGMVDTLLIVGALLLLGF